MSEVENISEVQQNTVPVEKTVADVETTSTPVSAEAETPAATEKQVVNNSIEADAAAGDAGTSAAEAAKKAESSPKVESTKKTPAKRTPSKRMSFIERAQKESEELVKNMGGSLELEGGRRTRSSARGTPTRATVVSTPPPTKKARTSPATASSTPSRGRGRGRKIDISEDQEEAKGSADISSINTPEKSKTPNKKKAATEKSNDKEENESEPTVESTPPTEDSEKAADDKKEETEASVSNEEKSEDKTDDRAEVEAISEEKLSDDKPESKAAEEPAPVEQKDKETPMETDDSLPADEPIAAASTAPEPTPAEEPTKVESATEKTTESTTEDSAPITLPKQLTPEPMDVDSNSKSSDVELIETVAPAAGEVSTEVSAPIHDAIENVAPTTEIQPVQETDIVEINLTDSESEVKTNNGDNTEDAILEETVQAPTASDVGSAESNTNALNTTNEVETNTKSDVAIEIPVAVDSAATESGVNENNDGIAKPQNDLCVPKVVSPSINNANNDGTVTTIL